jgi:hypothetical protein
MPMPTSRLLHRYADERALLFFQIYIFGLWLIAIVRDPLTRLAELPRGYYAPVGVLRLLPEPAEHWLLSEGGLASLKIALVTALVISLWPRAFRFVAPLAVVLLVVHQSLIRGWGHVNHAEILPLLAAGTLAIYAVLPRRRATAEYNPHAVPLITVALIITVCYSMIGFYRLHTSVSVFTGDSIINYVITRSLRASYFDFNLGYQVVAWPFAAWLLRVGYPLVTLVEALAPLVLFSRVARSVFLLVITLLIGTGYGTAAAVKSGRNVSSSSDQDCAYQSMRASGAWAAGGGSQVESTSLVRHCTARARTSSRLSKWR